MEPWSMGIGALQGLGSVFGLFGADAARKRAEQERAQLLAEYARQLDGDYQTMVGNDRHNLMAQTGIAGDALEALGRRAGSAAAGGGVYNSSAVAGLIANGQQQQQQALAGLAHQNLMGEQNLLSNNRQGLLNMRLGAANDKIGQAREQYAGAGQGLASFLGQLGQYNLARSGQNQTQNSLTRAAGGYGNPSVLKLGAGGLDGAVPTLGQPMGYKPLNLMGMIKATSFMNPKRQF